MKDKRQRQTAQWPFTDPSTIAYLVQAAASAAKYQVPFGVPHLGPYPTPLLANPFLQKALPDAMMLAQQHNSKSNNNNMIQHEQKFNSSLMDYSYGSSNGSISEPFLSPQQMLFHSKQNLAQEAGRAYFNRMGGRHAQSLYTPLNPFLAYNPQESNRPSKSSQRGSLKIDKTPCKMDKIKPARALFRPYE